MPINFKEIYDPPVPPYGPFSTGIQYVAAAGDISAAIAALPHGTISQANGVVILGTGSFSYASVLEYGYGTATSGGFTIQGQGKGVTFVIYTGTTTGMRPQNYTTAEQKKFVNFKDFTLVCANADVALDLKGSTYGEFDIEIIGASSIAGIKAGSIGIKLDGSYGANIGCWWNIIQHCRISGFETPIKLTGVAGSGQANENKILYNRINAYSRCGIDDDVGDNCLIVGNDCTTGTAGTVPTVAGIRMNSLGSKALANRFENIGSTGVCILLDGVGSKVADRCHVADNMFATEAGSIAVQINTNARENTIDLAQMFSRSPAVTQVVDNGLHGLTTWSSYGRNMKEVVFVATDITSSMSAVALDIAGLVAGNNRYPIARPYQIRGIVVRQSALITAGSITLTPTIGTSNATFSLTMTSADTLQGSTGQNMGVDTDTGQNGLGVKLTTSSDFTPSGSTDLTVIVLYEMTQ